MAAMANIVLTNAAAANVTFVPQDRVGNQAFWIESGAADLLHARRLVAELSKPANGQDGTLKVVWKIQSPTFDSVTGLLKFTDQYVLDNRTQMSAGTTRKNDQIALAKALAAHATVAAVLDSGALPS